jgi:MYXO-CTERM domain-containing protein
MSTVKTTLLAGLVALACATASTASTTIYQHSFGGFGGPLNGVATDVGGQNWQAGPVFHDDGAVATLVGSATGQAAWLPFTPAADMVYTLEATINNNKPDWIGVGFLPLLPNSAADWTQTGFGLRHSNNNSQAWILLRNNGSASDQQAFNGTGTTNGVATINGDLINPANPINIKIKLNTRAATWTAEYFMNGTSYGVNNLIAAASTNIRGVGFSRTSNGTDSGGGFVSAFSLTAIPEPGSGLLAMIGLVGIGSLRRRTRR